MTEHNIDYNNYMNIINDNLILIDNVYNQVEKFYDISEKDDDKHDIVSLYKSVINLLNKSIDSFNIVIVSLNMDMNEIDRFDFYSQDNNDNTYNLNKDNIDNEYNKIIEKIREVNEAANEIIKYIKQSHSSETESIESSISHDVSTYLTSDLINFDYELEQTSKPVLDINEIKKILFY